MQTENTLMERSSTIKVYTILRTATDSDRALFPDPQTKGSYLSLSRAQLELEKMIVEERTALDTRYDHEERTEDRWDARQSGYEAHCFIRLEIMASELSFTPMDRMYDFKDQSETEKSIAAEERSDLGKLICRLREEFCDCEIRAKKDPDMALFIMACQMSVETVKLQYTSLDGNEKRHLVQTGLCPMCGKAFCNGSLLKDGGSVFEKAWELLQQNMRPKGLCSMARPQYAADLYSSLFHKEDRSTARKWFAEHVKKDFIMAEAPHDI